MANNFVIRQVATAQGVYDANEETIYADLTANPGSTIADVVTSTGLSEVVVESIIKIMVDQSIVKTGYDIAGQFPYYWRIVDWVSLVLTNRDAARTWLANNDGSTVSDLATSLSIHEAVAEALAYFLRQEYSAVLTAQ